MRITPGHVAGMNLARIAIPAFLVLSICGAFGRVGETREQIEKRYGEGKRYEIQRLQGTETMVYHLNDTQVEVVFSDNKSIWEIFHPTRPEDIRLWLKANAEDGKTWHYDGLNDRWERSGTPLLIGYAWPGHEDFFCIKDVKAVEAVQNSGTGNDLKGF